LWWSANIDLSWEKGADLNGDIQTSEAARNSLAASRQFSSPGREAASGDGSRSDYHFGKTICPLWT